MVRWMSKYLRYVVESNLSKWLQMGCLVRWFLWLVRAVCVCVCVCVSVCISLCVCMCIGVGALLAFRSDDKQDLGPQQRNAIYERTSKRQKYQAVWLKGWDSVNG